VILAEGQDKARPIRAEARARFLEGIAKARHWLDELVTGSVMSTDQIAKREGVSERSVRMTLNLAFLAPDLVRAAVDGTLPASAGLSALSDLPLAWTRQRDEVAALSERST
jgi:DNA-binding transcriptional regulator LsrR (DeoR family)